MKSERISTVFSTDTGGWGRDKDEDELEWARRCARMANSMCKRRKGLHR